ncbi:ABC transporter ATP-binding protein [Companilactobacillus ginsenosidimutans]|uniref:ABC transporter domain-containing protein n=1 Tax=Companilactobacillus ginsenosidimutans TaxID=1007676 RepID=A0A0H4QCY6_9LACO|nr:ATP-binding cassette domain-containing protein [Companilactobacillus ginsenosidimutans]AKP66199.1 hypothetical protein ABM34_00640 [Companilactobacillus ginsenosidimutans]
MVEIVRFENYSFKYSNSSKVSLKNVNLTINKGDFALIIGKTGSGKSTLLRQLKPELALGKSVDGKLTLFGGENDNDFSHVAYISQFVDNQMVTETARDEFHFVLENMGVDADQIHSKIAEIASYFDIVDLMDLKEDQLSGGQKQIINLASALILNPDILLLDEPTSQLDPITSEKFLRMVEKINSDLNITIILVEHSIEQAVFFVNRVVLVDNGSIGMDEKTDSALRKLFTEPDFKNYLPQTDRLFLESQLDEVFPNVKLPLTNRRMNQIIQQQSDYLKYEDHISRKGSSSETDELSVKRLTFRFEFNARNILDDITFNLKKGKSYAILGPNGVGKTTLLRVITKQLEQLSGTVFIEGRKTNKMGQKFFDKLFILPQNPSLLFVTDSVQEEISYQLQQSNEQVNDDLVNQYLEKFQLTEIKNVSPYDISGGQQEYLALVIGLIKNPELLILDEPTKGLDPNMKQQVAKMLRNYQEQGGTILASTHDVLFSSKYFDFVSLMFDGRLGTFDPPIEFFPNKYFYTTEINKATRDQFAQALIWEDIVKNES